MKITIYYLSLLLIFHLFSCKQQEKEMVASEDIISILNTPDSLLNKSDLTLKYSVGDLMVEKSKVVNNQLILDITKDDFDKLGISEKYYEMVLKDIDNFNHFKDSLKLDASVMIENMKANYFKQKDSLKK